VQTSSTALVTGAGKRLGRATALALARRGHDVLVHYHQSRAEAEAVAEEIRTLGRKAWPVPCDLANPEAAATLVRRAVGMAGPLDVLVNSASVFPNGRVLDFSIEDLDANIRLNAFAPLALARAFAAQGRDAGAIVNFLDSRMTDYDAEHAAYHLSKRMLFSLTRMLALELAPRIRVNAVAPGLILPPPGKGTEYLEERKDTNPLRRFGTSEQVEEAVLFLVANEFVTGQVIFVDGGRHMRGAVYG